MIKVNHLRLFFPGIGILGLATSCQNSTRTDSLPNIVFILADDMGYGDLSCLNSNSAITTPNIDRIGKNGVIFSDAHSGSAVSTPTRYGILTGSYSWRSSLKKGVLDGYSEALIDSNTTTIASMLSSIGYNTGCIGKWHLGWHWDNIEKGIDSVNFDLPIKNGPLDKGFGYFFGISASLDMPPYVYIENNLPTSPPSRVTKGNGAQAGDSLYDGSFWREGPTGEDFEHSDCTPLFFKKAGDFIKEKAALDSPYFLYLALPSPHTPIVPGPEFKGRSSINPYADFVIEIDNHTGKLLELIEQTGEIDNTIIIFTSDNGCSPWADFNTLLAAGHNPNYIFRGHKADLYEGGHHIPCLLQWPSGIRKPHVIDQTFCLNDFMATFASITGYRLSGDEAADSYDFLPALKNAGYGEVIREATVHHSVNGLFAIRKGKWKLLLSPGSGGWSYPRPGKDEAGLPKVQLFDIYNDPGERNNLYQQHPEIVKELTDLLDRYISEGNSVKR